MQIIINIPEDRYNQLMSERDLPFRLDTEEYITDGTILPKGHGDLIDRRELKKVYDERITYLYTLNKKDNPSREPKICATNWCVNTIDELPAIIKADKESDTDENGN